MSTTTGFILRSKLHEDIRLDFCFWQNFHELNAYLKGLPQIENNLTSVSLADIQTLKREIEPMVRAIIGLDPHILTKYDDCGYPESFFDNFYGEDFNPATMGCAFAGRKLLKLWNCLNSLEEMWNDLLDWELIAYTEW